MSESGGGTLGPVAPPLIFGGLANPIPTKGGDFGQPLLLAPPNLFTFRHPSGGFAAAGHPSKEVIQALDNSVNATTEAKLRSWTISCRGNEVVLDNKIY